MLSLIKKIITANPGGTDNAVFSSQDQTPLAACVLLLEAAHIDDECTTEELNHLVSTLKKEFALDQAQVEDLIDLAGNERKNAIDLWQFTNYLNLHYSKEKKMALMESVWRIIFADGKLEMHEDHFAHKLANLLRLSHKEMIDAKLRARK
jgi:uncharacterized tellurite resistance protein B-like protein